MITETKVREFVAGMPETDEHPHFERIAFRVAGKIFGSIHLGAGDMNLRLTDELVEAMIAADPEAYRIVVWGKSRNWLNVNLKRARARDVRGLLEDAWEHRAPKRLLSR